MVKKKFVLFKPQTCKISQRDYFTCDNPGYLSLYMNRKANLKLTRIFRAFYFEVSYILKN